METNENMTSSVGLNETTSGPEYDPLPFEHFAPTLTQCFFIVLAGYFVGKAQLLSASDVRGVTSFAAYFAMPGIICISLADADLENVEWQLLVGTVVGKAAIFAIVAGSTMLLTRPSDVPMAGMLAMFCVQCNDLPVGNPLMSSLYGELRPHMLKYLFLIPALTIIFFSPICHFMMEFTNRKSKREHNDSERTNSRTSVYSRMVHKVRLFVLNKMTRDVMLNLLKSPVIIATFLGIVLNTSFCAHVPSVLHRPINVVATMIPGLALSVLGFSMLGKEKHLFSSGIILSTALVAVKMVLTPVVLYSVMKLLVADQHKEMLDFSLLYGIISPAAIIFQFGEKYRPPVAAMSAALILSSFSCFPLSYPIAKLSFIKDHDLNYYIPSLRFILLFIAIMSLLCCLTVWVTFIWNKRWRKPPCYYVSYLAFTQVLMSSGIILWQLSDSSHCWTLYGQVILACGGEIATYIWTATLSVVLVLQQNCPSTLRNNSVMLLLSSFGLSIVVTIVLCLLVFNGDFAEVMLFGQPRYNYEYLQLATTTSTLAICLFVIGTSFALYMRRKGPVENLAGVVPVPPEAQDDGNNVYKINLKVPESGDDLKRISSVSAASTVTAFNEEEEEKSLYYDEVIKTGEMEKSLVFGARWTFRHISLLTLLWITMAIKLLANAAKLLDCQTTAITVPLEYLQAVLFTGQGLWTFLTFGVDVRTIFMSVIKWWRRMRFGEEVVVRDLSAADNEEVQRVCCQFRTFFFDHSYKELAKERVWKKHHYRKSFWGHQMVNWLVKAGIAKDELEAEEYGQKLLLGGVICHVRNVHYFHDAPYLYYFLKK